MESTIIRVGLPTENRSGVIKTEGRPACGGQLVASVLEFGSVTIPGEVATAERLQALPKMGRAIDGGAYRLVAEGDQAGENRPGDAGAGWEQDVLA